MRRGLLFLFYLLFVSVSIAGSDPEGPGFPVKEKFEPGFGEGIGGITETRGEAFLRHEKQAAGFAVKVKLPLFMGDTILTMASGQVGIRLHDDSAVSLGPNTEIRIDECIFSPEGKTRNSLVTMIMGKARFWVKKIVHFRKSDFKVKTRTAILGVRGSDFVVDTTDAATTVQTLKDTNLLLTLMRGCENAAAVEKGDCEIRKYELTDFRRATIDNIGFAVEIRELTAAEIKQIQSDFPNIPADIPVDMPIGKHYSTHTFDSPAGNETPAVEVPEDIIPEIEDEFPQMKCRLIPMIRSYGG